MIGIEELVSTLEQGDCGPSFGGSLIRVQQTPSLVAAVAGDSIVFPVQIVCDEKEEGSPGPGCILQTIDSQNPICQHA